MAEQYTKNIIVNGNISQVYGLWEHFDNFPRFMENVKSVTKKDNKLSHWVVEGPMGKDIEWDAMITSLEPNKKIAWSSVEGDIKTTGEVRFKEISNEKTEVTCFLSYEPKGVFGTTFAKLFDNPEKKLEQDLMNFRDFAEQQFKGGSSDNVAGGFRGTETGTRGSRGRSIGGSEDNPEGLRNRTPGGIADNEGEDV
ncbi:MAG: SRPBCC family protein [candidate division Zixibacteria bacterium]|nr:SRPBCC family protein [candidate division Zixibacteria bacterium]